MMNVSLADSLIPKNIVFSETTIARRVRELAKEISNNYDELIMIVVLNGAMIFASDLIRKMTIPTQLDTIGISSYLYGQKQKQPIITSWPNINISDRDVLIVEDIKETGDTLGCATEYLELSGCISLKTCCLLTRPNQYADYVGFQVPQEPWYIGYGLNDGVIGRQLPYIEEVKRV